MENFENSISILDLPTDDELFLEADDGAEAGALQNSRRKKMKRRSSLGDIIETPLDEDVKETAVSAHGRWVVILVLCLCAGGVAFTTFTYIARTERDEFEATVSN